MQISPFAMNSGSVVQAAGNAQAKKNQTSNKKGNMVPPPQVNSINDRETAKKNNNKQAANPNDQIRDEQIKQLQALIERQTQELDNAQKIFRDQLGSIPQDNSQRRSEIDRQLNSTVGAKSAQLSQLNQMLSQTKASGSIGGFVGQQAGGSGIGFNIQA